MVLEALIGQSDEPFQVTVQYSSCSGHEVGFLAIDSLELMDCVMGDYPTPVCVCLSVCLVANNKTFFLLFISIFIFIDCKIVVN